MRSPTRAGGVDCRNGFFFPTLILAAFGVGALLTGCGQEATPALPPDPAVVTVTMRDYSFDFNPRVPAGRVTFQVRNSGKLNHQLKLLRLPDDLKGTLDEQLRSPVRKATHTLVALPIFKNGEASQFAADLFPGRYGFVCFLEDPDGSLHALKGMNSDFAVMSDS